MERKLVWLEHGEREKEKPGEGGEARSCCVFLAWWGGRVNN